MAITNVNYNVLTSINNQKEILNMHIVTIILQSFLIFMFLMAGSRKLTGDKTAIEEFKSLRLPQWFRVFTGGYELVAAAALIIGYWDGSWIATGSLLTVIFAIIGTLAMLRVKEPFKNMIMIIVIAIFALILFFKQCLESCKFPWI
ncbi:DoxX family protein [Niallia circulans]